MAQSDAQGESGAIRSFDCLVDDFLNFRQQGLAVALVTLVRSEGGAPRPLGSQMVVAGNGLYVGHLTGGCAEAVIADEACAALEDGRNRTLRLGAGSGYLDVQLPCGASVELYIDVSVADDTIQAVRRALCGRHPVALDTQAQGEHKVVVNPGDSLEVKGFCRWYFPARRLLVFGKGPNAFTLARLARESDFVVSLYSPDCATLAACEGTGVELATLTSPDATPVAPTDAFSAAVLMFHEHDWEPALLKPLLQSDCFYIGALGSRRTHHQRCELLGHEGFAHAEERIHGPVGLDIGAGNPIEIALSILAEIVQEYRLGEGSRPLLTWARSQIMPPGG